MTVIAESHSRYDEGEGGSIPPRLPPATLIKEEQMRWHDPMQYIKLHHWNPDAVIECAICPTKFVARNGFAFPASAHGEPIIGYFCTEMCYLAAMPRETCGHA
jgi:hypothetical protein